MKAFGVGHENGRGAAALVRAMEAESAVLQGRRSRAESFSIECTFITMMQCDDEKEIQHRPSTAQLWASCAEAV